MKAPEFDLLGVDGKRHSLATAKGSKGLLVMFICNHCPYVKRSLDRTVREHIDQHLQPLDRRDAGRIFAAATVEQGDLVA